MIARSACCSRWSMHEGSSGRVGRWPTLVMEVEAGSANSKRPSGAWPAALARGPPPNTSSGGQRQSSFPSLHPPRVSSRLHHHRNHLEILNPRRDTSFITTTTPAANRRQSCPPKLPQRPLLLLLQPPPRPTTLTRCVLFATPAYIQPITDAQQRMHAVPIAVQVFAGESALLYAINPKVPSSDTLVSNLRSLR